jgi:hypothetical protein
LNQDARVNVVRLAIIVLVAVLPGSAAASKLLSRDVPNPSLRLQGSLHAYVSSRGTFASVCCAVNSRFPSRAIENVKFSVRYGVRPHGGCVRAYLQLPLLARPVCRARNGSYWAIQGWRRLMPNHGGTSAPAELRVSHFTLPVAHFVDLQWRRRYGAPLLYGRLVWRGRGVYGFCSDSRGSPCDSYSRLVFLDTYNSRLGRGWHHENSFLTQGPGQRGYRCGAPGCFEYSFSGRAAAALGQQFRLTADGPGVTPIVRTSVAPPP